MSPALLGHRTARSGRGGRGHGTPEGGSSSRTGGRRGPGPRGAGGGCARGQLGPQGSCVPPALPRASGPGGAPPPTSHTHLHGLPAGPQAAWRRDRDDGHCRAATAPALGAGRGPRRGRRPRGAPCGSSAGRPTPRRPGQGDALWQPAGTQTSVLVLKRVMPSGQKQPSETGPASCRALRGAGGWPGPCDLGLGARGEGGRAPTPG